jgi:hypothetical protein
MSLFLMSFPFLNILNSLQSFLIVYILFVCLLVKETAEIETRMADKSSWDQANIRQNLGLVWRIRKNISQIIKDYFYLPVFLLIILCTAVIKLCVVLHLKIDNTNICNTSLRVLCAVYMLSSFIKRSPNYQCLALRAFQLMEAGTRGGGCCGDECILLCVFESEASFHYVHYRLLTSLTEKEDLSYTPLCDGAMHGQNIYKDTKS